jgi:hypothetical protein
MGIEDKRFHFGLSVELRVFGNEKVNPLALLLNICIRFVVTVCPQLSPHSSFVLTVEICPFVHHPFAISK